MTDSNPPSPLHVLLVEDDPIHKDLLSRALSHKRPHVQISCEDTGRGMLMALTNDRFDCIVLDYNLPDQKADEALEAAAEVLSGTPVIVVSSSRSQEVVFRSLRAGGVDFVQKADAINSDELWMRVSHAVNQSRESRQSKEEMQKKVTDMYAELNELRSNQENLQSKANEMEGVVRGLVDMNTELSIQARTDSLTGLLNRGVIQESIEEQNLNAQNLNRPYGVIMIDVDHFKNFNDHYGHPAGDECLVQIARAIQDTVRSDDLVGRYGGEEFIVICPGVDGAQIQGLAERLCAAIKDLGINHATNPVSHYVTVSLGLGLGPKDSWEDVVLEADTALYQAKRAGRNQVRAAA